MTEQFYLVLAIVALAVIYLGYVTWRGLRGRKGGRCGGGCGCGSPASGSTSSGLIPSENLKLKSARNHQR
jgi:hypothetical protein